MPTLPPRSWRRAVTATVLALTVNACTPAATTAPQPATTAALSDVCGAVEHPAKQVASHLIGNAEPPVDYTSVPPTSGWHTTTRPEPGVVHHDVRDPELVAALEAGTVVLAITPDVLAQPDVRDQVDAVIAQFPERLAAVAYDTAMPTPVTLLTWGRLSRCDRVDPAAVTTFVLMHRVALPH